MTIETLVDVLGLDPINLVDAAETTVEAAYCGDLLSDVLGNAKPGSVWFTIQGHMNVIAVAQLRDIACIVLVNGVAPDPQTVAKAKSQGVSLCGSEETSAELCMKLAGRLS